MCLLSTVPNRIDLFIFSEVVMFVLLGISGPEA